MTDRRAKAVPDSAGAVHSTIPDGSGVRTTMSREFTVQVADALSTLALARSEAEHHSALADVRFVLGPQTSQFEPLIEALTHRFHELVKFERLATYDWLTGAVNGRCFAEAVSREVARSQRCGTHFGVVLLDLDDLKLRNDQHGHAAGDAALIALVNACKGELRATDMLARIGGDEFAALLVDTGGEGTRIAARRMRAAIEHVADVFGPLRVSIGSAASDQEDLASSDVVSAADTDLYRDKFSRKGPRSEAPDEVTTSGLRVIRSDEGEFLGASRPGRAGAESDGLPGQHSEVVTPRKPRMPRDEMSGPRTRLPRARREERTP